MQNATVYDGNKNMGEKENIKKKKNNFFRLIKYNMGFSQCI